jgi:hypothetical protein
MKTQLLKVYAEVYELERGGWLCKTRGVGGGPGVRAGIVVVVQAGG